MPVLRFQMTLLLMATGGAGFLASYGLLQLGMDRMALRYPLSVGIAYLVFFLLLRLWISLQREPEEWSENAVDLAGEAVEAGLDGLGSLGRVPSRGGGSFGGAGASASFDAPIPVASSSPGFDLPDVDVDLDDNLFWVVLAVIAAVAAVVVGTVAYVIYLAPILFAEVLVDGVLLASLYKRLKMGPEPEYWAFGAIKRTWIPALIVAFTFFIAGLAIQDMYPQARSIGGVWTTAPRSSDQR